MSFAYTEFKRRLARGLVDWNAVDIRFALLLNTTTADTEEDVTTLSAFTTLGEITDGSYSRKALANEAATADNTNNRAEMTGDSPVQWLTLTTGGTVQGVLVYIHVGADSANIPVAFIDSGGFPFSASGVTFNININAEGLLQLT